MASTISNNGSIRGQIPQKGFGSTGILGSVSIGDFSVGAYEPYTDSYEVTPSTLEQVLHTANKVLKNDITVHAIPYTETSNQAGGYTCYIAGGV